MQSSRPSRLRYRSDSNRSEIFNTTANLLPLSSSGRPSANSPMSPGPDGQIRPEYLIPSIGPKDRIHPANPALILAYLDIFLRCTDVNRRQVVPKRGPGGLARVASTCLLYALSTVDPTPAALETVYQLYTGVFPPHADFEGFPLAVPSAQSTTYSTKASRTSGTSGGILSHPHMNT